MDLTTLTFPLTNQQIIFPAAYIAVGLAAMCLFYSITVLFVSGLCMAQMLN